MKEPLSSFNAIIDYRDIESTDILKIVNEKALMSDNDSIKEAYMFDIVI